MKNFLPNIFQLLLLILLALSLAGSANFLISFVILLFVYLCLQLIFFNQRWGKDFSESNRKASEPTFLALAILMVILCGAMIFSPTVLNWDEGYYLNTALGFIDSGSLFVRMWRIPEPTSLIVGGGQGYGILLYLGFLSLTGVNYVAARLFSYCLVLLALALCYIYVKEKFDKESAKWSTLVFALSIAFLQLVSARFDSAAICIMFLLLIAWQRIHKTQKFRNHFALGAASILAMEFHVHAAAYACGLALAYIKQAIAAWRNENRTKKNAVLSDLLSINFVPFLLGAVSLTLPYLFIHYLKDSQAFFTIAQHCVHCGASFLEREAQRIGDLATWYSTEFLFVLITLIWAVHRARNDYDHEIKNQLWILGGAYLCFVLLIPPHYEFFLWPIVAPLSGLMISELLEKTNKHKIFGKSLLVCFLLAIAFRTASLGLARVFPDKETKRIVKTAACIKQALPQDSVIASPGPLFIYFENYINFLEIGRGIVYPTLIDARLRELGEKAAVEKLLEAELPDLIWIESSDYQVAEHYFTKFALERPATYETVSENLFVKSSAVRDQILRCLSEISAKQSK